MNEFLSRFTHAIRPTLTAAFPSTPPSTLNAMLLLICQRLVSELDPSSVPPDLPSVDLSDDLWQTITSVSASVHDSMRRDRTRLKLKNYLHCDDVKQMVHFAVRVGVRGDMLRELRFQWAKEKLEEVEADEEIEQMYKMGKREDNVEEKRKLVEALPERKGKIKYAIYGLDMSDPKWGEVAERVEETERKFVKEEPREVVGRCKRIEERVFSEEEDFAVVLGEWKEALEARRVDWLALLERIKEKDVALYFKVAEFLLDEQSFEPNIRDYSRLIDAHFKANRIEEAERILNKMSENGIQPDIIISLILLHMYSNVGNLDRAKEAFESLKEQDFPLDLKAYTSMITAYLKAGLPKQGETLTREMDSRGIKPTEEIYMEILRSFAQQGQVDGAQRIMNTMQFAGVQPTLESFTLLIRAYGQAGDPDQARGYFDQMIRSGHKPDDECTASMMMAYVKKNHLDKALDLLLTLEKDGFKRGIATKTVLVDWFGRLQLVEEAEKVLKEITAIKEPPFEIHVSLCDMYSRAAMEEKARKSLKILEGRKNLLRADQFERIVSGLLAGGMMDEAQRMYNSMQGLGFSPSESVRVALMAQSIPRHRPANNRQADRDPKNFRRGF